jgi:hypothetical protein
MKQLELEFFWPLTQQIPLELDFTPSIRYQEEKNKNSFIGQTGVYAGAVLSSGGWTTISNSLPPTTEVKISSDEKTVGKYRVGNSNFYIHMGEKPNAITRWAMKHVFSFHWINT